MATNLLNWFGGTKGELREAIPSGSAAEVEIPPESSPRAERILRAPDGREQPLALPEGVTKATVGPLDRVGIWSVASRAGGVARGNVERKAAGGASDTRVELACNLENRRESDLRPAEGLPVREASLAAGLGVRPIWYYLLATAWLLSCWEWFLYQRRWID
jgi:hypothetical protein